MRDRGTSSFRGTLPGTTFSRTHIGPIGPILGVLVLAVLGERWAGGSSLVKLGGSGLGCPGIACLASRGPGKSGRWLFSQAQWVCMYVHACLSGRSKAGSLDGIDGRPSVSLRRMYTAHAVEGQPGGGCGTSSTRGWLRGAQAVTGGVLGARMVPAC